MAWRNPLSSITLMTIAVVHALQTITMRARKSFIVAASDFAVLSRWIERHVIIPWCTPKPIGS